jgi:hypothetical protein
VIEFVSYTGKFPNLCSGILTVRVDGKTWHFGYPWKIADRELVPRLPPFWESGGCAGVTEDLDEFCAEGPWKMDDPNEKDYPPEVFARLPDILAVMNENVPHGCCGGCI